MKKLLLITATCISGLVTMAQSYAGNKTRTQVEKMVDQYCSPQFKTADGSVYDLTDDNTSAVSYLNILDWLQGRVAGLQVYTFRHGLKVPFIRGSQASIYVDEMPVDAGYLNVLPVNDIAFIKVIKAPFASIVGNNSVIAVYTIMPEEETEEAN
jgi:hypothetical protein